MNKSHSLHHDTTLPLTTIAFIRKKCMKQRIGYL